MKYKFIIYLLRCEIEIKMQTSDLYSIPLRHERILKISSDGPTGSSESNLRVRFVKWALKEEPDRYKKVSGYVLFLNLYPSVCFEGLHITT